MSTGLLIFFTSLVTGPGLVDAQAQESGSFNLVEISPGNYLHQGIHAGFGEPGHDDIANIGFIRGDKCIAVVDTGGSVTVGRSLLAAIRNITDKPICYVINTHVHFDHVLGNLAFTGEKPEFIGHAGLKEAMEASRAFFLKDFSGNLGETPGEQSIIGPDTLVAESLTVDLGGKTLLLTAWPKAHTHADLTVLDQKTGTLWAGDLIFRERIPVIDGSLKGWLEVMQKLKELNAAFIVPGHGTPGSAWLEVAAAQETYLSTLLNDTRRAIAEGQFLEEAVETIGVSEKGHWQLFDQQHKTNVSRVFVELEWE